ncbi:translation initiation factor [Desulfurococcus mucosus]|uniref:Translation initiation factor 1 (EIF-1/SUI1) n=1 Tax=Desulfurococcus mucosus (strain ATCC 35584 / DSM 2162 / JCM 9187 / O7/1) TaxID=765177 RepID=E8R7P9_DESM0|nr:translation initiation factor [Desulfurococcus mucosus]ADV64544.1 translation initiation factor 1 (eIF-1/SUI1) [Desulfurococcus mucosus DSM 2162]
MEKNMDETPCGGLPPELCEQASLEQSLVKIRLDTRKFGKAVTIVDGLPNDKEFLKQVAKALKTKLATGGTFKEGRIELQGDHRHRVKQILIEDFGIPPENILVID